MSLSEELAYTTTTELARRIRDKELSPVEVMDATIARIEARNPSVNALVFTAFDEARERARQAEKEVVSGAELGPLHGVPTALKDLFQFKPGWKATCGGVRALKDFAPDMSSLFADRMEQAGAIVLGMTNSPVMGFRGACDNYLFGPTRNPFDLTRNSGGSSGGSAAAVGDGLLTVAQGGDGGGSIRIPSSWCGVFGYKASFGRVPITARPNGFSHCAPFLFDGAITRTVDDAALALSVLAGPHPADPHCLPDSVDFLAAPTRGIEGKRIAYSPNLDVFPVDRRVSAVVDQAVRAFEEAGARVEEVTIGIQRPQQELSNLWCRLITPLNLQIFQSFKEFGIDLLKDHREDFPPEYLRWIDAGHAMLAVDWFRDQAGRTEVFDVIQSVLTNYDLLVTPTLSCLPVANADNGNTMGPTEIEGEAVDPLIGWCLTYPINFSGHPAASVPAGMTDGLPVGMQVVARRGADGDLLAACGAFERLRPWQETYQICAQRR
ncbi:MAG: amidase family protein [Pseudomonadota bacterium]